MFWNKLKRDVQLSAPRLMLTAESQDPSFVARICNGAGPRGYGWAVPDTIWGLSVTRAANIHDWMYHFGKSEADRERADRVFRNNMMRLIEHASGPDWLKWLRRRRALKYYWAVRKFGANAFWTDEKNEARNEVQVLVEGTNLGQDAFEFGVRRDQALFNDN